MKSTEGMRLVLTNLACKQAVRKGFTADEIKDAFEHPTSVTPNKTRDGQYVINKGGVFIIGVPNGDKFVGVTMKEPK
jgi:hypothetical protein